ncbi:uncharacterized protein FA14DRAFT_186877 [Meira miltonrushii]|uniref:Uncharacterized protein n=1 Tax=Meira miltonrushii TaxID=1280837 RepID=A0A316VGH6_9BASI|nr:uncharacterized protein FA14DRAFT_186877 [Meira miltonrushii]PWN36692.1 hypothetical protein FA14DRAFT_186877 [Meira miltonrushii]
MISVLQGYIIGITAIVSLIFCTRTDGAHSPDDKSQGSWSGLSDILEINQFDPTWQGEVQSGYRGDANTSQNNEGGQEKAKRKKIRLSTPEKQQSRKLRRQRFNDALNSDPVRKDIYKKKKAEWNRAYKARRRARITGSEKKAFKLLESQANRRYYMKRKEKYGGYSCPMMQRLNEIKKLHEEGKANEEDLKILHDYREGQKLARRKQRAAQKSGTHKG